MNVRDISNKRVCQIHRDLGIADQWIEAHSLWQTADLNGVKYL
jgi:hypothetical protein